MKTNLLMTALAVLSLVGIVTARSQDNRVSDLVASNVEALSFNEWGGGNEMGGVVVQYEYEEIDFYYKYCRPNEYAPFEWCACYSKTCHGYGDEFCYGVLYCFPVNGNDPDDPFNPNNPYDPDDPDNPYHPFPPIP